MATFHTHIGALKNTIARMQKFSAYEIHKSSGVNYATVWGIYNGKQLNPTIGTVDKINSTLDKMEQEQ